MLLLIAAAPAAAQERGAAALGELVDGLGVNTRVLMIGAHPDDEDTFLITWLQRGRHVETAYLSLTRGDGGQNLIGNELGEALGVIRTQELLAARRIDGAEQYFTRAFDFGFSKDTIDTYKHWQRDSILNDVVRVVRAFRPHVIIAVFSGTPRDGHGHHQVSGLLARAAYDLAGDTAKYPVRGFGQPWIPLKFYRAARFNPQAATLSMNVGEYSPLLGRSYGEIAGESRSQHKSQGFGVLQEKGPIIDYVQREATRVNAATVANTEKSIFDGLDTTWARFQGVVTEPAARLALEALPRAIAKAQSAFDARSPERLIAPLRTVHTALHDTWPKCGAPCLTGSESERDLQLALLTATRRLDAAAQLASGITVEAVAAREVVPERGRVPVTITVYNRGRDTVRVSRPGAAGKDNEFVMPGRALAPGARMVDSVMYDAVTTTEPAWLRRGRVGAMFAEGPGTENAATIRDYYDYLVDLDSPAADPLPGRAPVAPPFSFMLRAPITVRIADQVRGELWRPLSIVRAPVELSLTAASIYAPVATDLDFAVDVHVRANDDSTRDVLVTLNVPAGLTPDSVSRHLRVGGRNPESVVKFRVRGRFARVGTRNISAIVSWGSQLSGNGSQLINYDHITPQRINHRAIMDVAVVDVKVPDKLRVAYVPGVGDNVAPTLTQLGIPTTVMSAAEIGRADLSGYSTVVIGTRAYEAHPELLAANPKLFDFARKGGVLLVQYGQYEMTQPGAMPYPITLARPADRVTEEDAAVTIDAPNAMELAY
ncbi:MAG TPA: PIG-L family deacetylase, partial [Gemmatimonadaceae bacterium]